MYYGKMIRQAVRRFLCVSFSYQILNCVQRKINHNFHTAKFFNSK